MGCVFLAVAGLFRIAAPTGALAQKMPTIDADGQLGAASVGQGSLHAVIDFKLQNGDFSRGKYDDDAANLDRLPFAVGVTLGWQLHNNTDGKPDLWLEAGSSNGFHSPIAIEHASPRAWYDNNNVVALLYKPSEAVTAALSYAIKTSPNGVSPTSHELTTAFGYQTKAGIGFLRPSTAISFHTEGGSGVYTLFGLQPTFALSSKEDGPTLAIPARFGIGWDDFYGPGSGNAAYGSVGLSYAHPFALGSAHLKFQAEALALIRDDTVRALGKADAEHSTVVPLVTLGISMGL